jgi:hypothetical protein
MSAKVQKLIGKRYGLPIFFLILQAKCKYRKKLAQ